jgi:murein DD-endopeptidase MepM/ murein hydrolase activator NlpD
MRTTLLLCLLALPLRHLQVTSAFGNRIHPLSGTYKPHAGVDLKANYDTVYAVINGRLTYGFEPALGVFIKITSGPLTITYGHLSQIFTDDSVNAGSPIAISGATGKVTGPHLHFAVQFNHRYIDPLAFLAAGFQQMNH